MTILFRLILCILPTVAFSEDGWRSIDLAGIHYAVERSILHSGRWQERLHYSSDCRPPSCSIDFDERISALHLRYKWAHLNPEKDVYNFTELGSLIDEANEAGKYVTINIMAGKYTPSWVFNEGAAHLSMEMMSGDDFSQPLMPIPWDPTFEHAYFELMNHLAEYLRQTPHRYRTVALIKNGAFVVHSGETRLMPPKAFDRDIGKDDDTRKDMIRKELCADWAQAGYSEDRVVQAISDMNLAIARAFPDQYIGISFVGGSNRFPTVNKKGACAFPEKNKTISRILKDFIDDYGNRAVVTNTVLTEHTGNPNIMQWVLKHGGKTSYQLERYAIGCREPKIRQCDDDAINKAFESGISAGGIFIEIHDGNIHRHREYLEKYNRALTK
ncbi:hypothetical protein [Paracoccus saliphilus]|uniref:Glycoside hydrolase family 42 N-terminal domain-containing protein n=1 Tax=Paracoccus saliphilus TaxID=405559 RepID=A0AA46A6G7_9RHOB|nr:hypothetical protein [Paracoccus saliphilus]SIS97252.1 hypothetical protein SAMN05421772_110156 [Paracoccus saliphilus]